MKKIILVMLSFYLFSCGQTITKMALTDISKADGVINFEYRKMWVDKENIDKNKYLNKSIKICKNWNYKSAEFLTANYKCLNYDGLMQRCITEDVFVKYQCLN